MEKVTMGRVVVPAKVENLVDLVLAERGMMAQEQVHRIDVDEALVDTGSTLLSMPLKAIRALGFDKPIARRPSTTAMGECMTDIYGPVKLTVQDRFCLAEVAEIADGCPVLIGQIPLETLDFIVDPKRERLIGNPRHHGEQMIDLF